MGWLLPIAFFFRLGLLMRLLLGLFIVFFYMPFYGCWAVPIERNLPVSAFITVNQASSQLEFFADKYIFNSVYDMSQKTFYPLTIPFGVRSVNGENVSYDIYMSHLGAQCDGGAINVSVFSSGGGEVILNKKYRFAGVQNNHDVVLYFPVIAPGGTQKQCQGHVGFIAESVF
ncbi:hypothetical protein C3737_22090 [Aeromonas jandaei]|uniref:hypothetical protein n=1 Tax=Aeromonas jandaei TaxID=650 RepID=UPI000CE1B715|nr:hypothetical protein [Aeromonas jandaei]PPA27880.1 hypothetical protein C3737_22090 [Aeromonas jandaei]